MSRLRTLLPLCAVGCYPSILDTLDPGPGTTNTLPTITIDTGAGAAEFTVDATDYDAWVAFDLDTLSFVDETTDAWDLAFRRFDVKLDGGISGDGGVEASPVEALTIDEVATEPTDGWRTDAADDDDDGIPEYALEDWYVYDYDTHLLSPNATVWVIRSNAGGVFKLEFLDYYDDVGTPARISVVLATL